MTGVTITGEMIDINSAQEVEIEIGIDGRLWINVDGICRLRAQGSEEITVIQARQPQVIFKYILPKEDGATILGIDGGGLEDDPDFAEVETAQAREEPADTHWCPKCGPTAGPVCPICFPKGVIATR